MAHRMIARGRHVSTAVLLWSSATLMALADAFATASVHSTLTALRPASLALAIAAGFLLGTAILRGVGSLVARVRIRQALAAYDSAITGQVDAEVTRGIAQLEAFLAEQHSRGA
ncbi:MAG: hypothetical protein QOH99_1573 [Frankiaceae bacterium]|jgi:hypothetical protein|nr:hypothetical protein [Frankiaceae bacterium]